MAKARGSGGAGRVGRGGRRTPGDCSASLRSSGWNESSRRRRRPGTRSTATRAAQPLCRSAAACSGSPRGDDGRAARLSTQDAVASWDDACRDGAAGAARTAGAVFGSSRFLLPSPRAHQVRYRGVLTPCSSALDHVAPAGPEVLEAVLTSREADGGSTGAADGGGASVGVDPPNELLGDRRALLTPRIAWADLLKRVFEVDALRCPDCGGRLRLLAAITDPSVARRILEWLALPPRAPPLAGAKETDPACGPGDGALEPTWTKAHQDPAYEFDQTPADDPYSNEGS